LRSFDRYEEVRREFNIMSPVVTTSQVTISGPAMPVQPLVYQQVPIGSHAPGLEERVRALELENRAL